MRVKDRYEADGWIAMHKGAPDFLMLRIEDGSIKDYLAVEVKSPSSDLTFEQRVYRDVLKKAGVEYIVEVEQ